jgi:hypothetical protein
MYASDISFNDSYSYTATVTVTKYLLSKFESSKNALEAISNRLKILIKMFESNILINMFSTYVPYACGSFL